jgi:hypothetical protein
VRNFLGLECKKVINKYLTLTNHGTGYHYYVEDQRMLSFPNKYNKNSEKHFASTYLGYVYKIKRNNTLMDDISDNMFKLNIQCIIF